MNKEELKKSVEYYMSLKYPIKVSEMEEGGYFVEVIDLPGCMCDVNTLEEIPRKLEKTKRAWIEGALERGGQILLPKKEKENRLTQLMGRWEMTALKFVQLAQKLEDALIARGVSEKEIKRLKEKIFFPKKQEK